MVLLERATLIAAYKQVTTIQAKGDIQAAHHQLIHQAQLDRITTTINKTQVHST